MTIASFLDFPLFTVLGRFVVDISSNISSIIFLTNDAQQNKNESTTCTFCKRPCVLICTGGWVDWTLGEYYQYFVRQGHI